MKSEQKRQTRQPFPQRQLLAQFNNFIQSQNQINIEGYHANHMQNEIPLLYYLQ